MKIISGILAILVLSTSLNLELNFHYCFEELVNVSFESHKKTCKDLSHETNNKCHNKTSKNCCSDKALNLNLEQNKDKPSTDLNIKLHFTDSDLKPNEFVSTLVESVLVIFSNKAPPPILFKRYIFNKSLLIYG